MPLTYHIDPTAKIVTITGDYAEAEGWRTMLSAVANDPDYRRGFNFLRDLRHAEHPVSAEAVIGIVGVVRKFWDVLGVSRAAIVTRPGTIDYPAVIAQALADDQHIALQAFPSYDDAVAWLQAAAADKTGSPE
jgi:hypothetical protein